MRARGCGWLAGAELFGGERPGAGAGQRSPGDHPGTESGREGSEAGLLHPGTEPRLGSEGDLVPCGPKGPGHRNHGVEMAEPRQTRAEDPHGHNPT